MRRLPTIVAASLLLALVPCTLGQDLAKRLVLKDGSYQLVTKYEVKGDRVRYLSAERNEWEEVPNDLVDWKATEQFEKERAAGKPAPEAVELDKELAAERAAEEANTPEVAPGLRLPEEGGVQLLDTFQGQPQLVEIDQNSGQVKKNMKGNILRAAINPIAGAKQTIELPGQHAHIQSHSALPSVYVNIESGGAAPDMGPGHLKDDRPPEPELPWDRFKIVRMQAKGDKRIVGDIKIAVYGKTKQEGSFLTTNSQQLTGGWVKVTPAQPLDPGEYALVETLGKEGINLYAWDFGVNPNAPANGMVTKPDASASAPQTDQEKPLEKRQ
jgi:hypothetical protein